MQKEPSKNHSFLLHLLFLARHDDAPKAHPRNAGLQEFFYTNVEIISSRVPGSISITGISGIV